MEFFNSLRDSQIFQKTGQVVIYTVPSANRIGRLEGASGQKKEKSMMEKARNTNKIKEGGGV